MPPVSPTLSLSHCRCPQVLRELHRSCPTEEGQDDLKKGTLLLYPVGAWWGVGGGCGCGVWEEGALGGMGLEQSNT